MAKEKDQKQTDHQAKPKKPKAQKAKGPLFEQKCPQCGAPMNYDPELEKMVCEYCGTTSEIEKFGTVEEQMSRLERDRVLEEMQPLPVYTCSSCGAEVIVAEETGTLTCPYCKNNIVITEKFSGTIKPDGIIPFKFTARELRSRTISFFKTRRLLAKTFLTKGKFSDVTGVYVPFWVFDVDTYGDIDYHGEHVGAATRDGNYIETLIHEYRLERQIQASFNGISVDASKKMADDLMDSICPYNFDELVPFDVGYLAGFVADRFDQTSDSIRHRSDKRINNTISDLAMWECCSGFSGVYTMDSNIQNKIKQAKYVLLPVYFLNVEYEGKNYPFAINGQTGKVAGKFPKNVKLSILYFAKRFAIGFAAMAALLWFLFVR